MDGRPQVVGNQTDVHDTVRGCHFQFNFNDMATVPVSADDTNIWCNHHTFRIPVTPSARGIIAHFHKNHLDTNIQDQTGQQTGIPPLTTLGPYKSANALQKNTTWLIKEAAIGWYVHLC